MSDGKQYGFGRQLGRYLLFVFDGQEPTGGWSDLRRWGESIDDLREKAAKEIGEVYQIVDLRHGAVVEQRGIRELAQERCAHEKTHRVHPPPPGAGIIVSGAIAVPGLYCSTCRKYLGR